MTAPFLLETLRARGARLSVANRNGTQVLLVSPRGIVTDLADDVARFKPSLLELLKSEKQPNKSGKYAGRRSWKDRNTTYWNRVRDSVSPGAVAICDVLQSYNQLFILLQSNHLPQGTCRAQIDGEALVFEDVPGVLAALLHDWTQRAESCNAINRALTDEEALALYRAKQFLKWMSAARGETQWLDLLNGVTK